MSAPIVYFEIAGPDGASLREFYSAVFGWHIDGGSAISAASTGGLRGGIREDPVTAVARLSYCLYSGRVEALAFRRRLQEAWGTLVG